MSDYDPPRCWTRTMPRARKRHRCCECRGNIQPGEVYERFSGIWDYPMTFKTCSDCNDLRKIVDPLVNFECPFSMIADFIHDMDEPRRSALLQAFNAIYAKRAPKPPPTQETLKTP